LYNKAIGQISFIGCGYGNSTTRQEAAVVAGRYNVAAGVRSFAGGGYLDTLHADYGVIVGGYDNLAGLLNSDTAAAVVGGRSNQAGAKYSFVGGGRYNASSGSYAAIGGGYSNTASGAEATVSGGSSNIASATVATVAGGYCDSSLAHSSFTTNSYSVVPSSYTGSSAFNGQAATAAGQTRVGALSKTSGTFTIDHPLDPENKILNHYFVESPEMVLIYRGSAVIGPNGTVVVHLPDYFDALNKSPMIQLTGVKSNDVWVEEEVKNNEFAIGGKPGIKVYWTVTGERKDPSAEITKIIMPVEQAKGTELAGRSLDDDFLVVTKEQLERMGKATGFKFRHAASQKRYEEMKKMMEGSK
jgi:hypothetical protein